MDVLEAGRPADHAEAVAVARAIDVGAGREQALGDIEMTASRRPVQRGRLVGAVALARVEAPPQQQAHAVEMAAFGGQMQQRRFPRPAGEADLARMGGEQLAERARLAGDRGRDHLAVDAERVDLGFERPPARKSVVAHDGELGLAQLGRGLTRPQFGKPLLGGLLQPIEIGLGRESLFHHAPSSSAPGSAAHGQERRNDDEIRSQVGSTLYADGRSLF